MSAPEIDPEGTFEMSAFLDSYVLRVLLRHQASSRGEADRRQRWLRARLFDPYRPELHYMRGPGPKWREKRTLAKFGEKLQ